MGQLFQCPLNCIHLNQYFKQKTHIIRSSCKPGFFTPGSSAECLFRLLGLLCKGGQTQRFLSSFCHLCSSLHSYLPNQTLALGVRKPVRSSPLHTVSQSCFCWSYSPGIKKRVVYLSPSKWRKFSFYDKYSLPSPQKKFVLSLNFLPFLISLGFLGGCLHSVWLSC